MTRQEAIELAREYAKKYQPSYYVEPFEPHEWVVEAIIAADRKGYFDGVYKDEESESHF